MYPASYLTLSSPQVLWRLHSPDLRESNRIAPTRSPNAKHSSVDQLWFDRRRKRYAEHNDIIEIIRVIQVIQIIQIIQIIQVESIA